jgi:hypothetical protein
MKRHLWAILLVCAMLLGLVPSALAQGVDLNCLGLSADDCKIVTDATANTANLRSFNQSFTFELNVSGMETLDPTAEPVALKASGSGPFVFNPAAESMQSGFAMALDMTGEANGESGAFSLVIVDGVLYFKDPSNDKWMGIKLEDAMGQAGALTGGLVPGIGSSDSGTEVDPAAAQAAMGAMSALATFDPFAIDGFANQSRLGDESLDGQTMYAFQHTFNLDALFKSPQFQKLLTDLGQVAAQADQSAAQVAMMLPMISQLATGEIAFTRWIGADDGFAHRIVLSADLNIDLNAMMGASGSSGQQMPPINLQFSLSVDMSNINDTAAPVAPEGAEMIDLSEAMSGM